MIEFFYAVGVKRFSVKFPLKLDQLQNFDRDPPYGLYKGQETNRLEPMDQHWLYLL